MFKKISYAVMSVLLFISMPVLAALTPSQTQQIQSILNHWRAQLQIPAAALSISLPESNTPITFVSGTTTADGSQGITSHTLFQAGSISKSFTAMMMLQLVAQGKVNLDDPITDYLPQYSQWDDVTIRELLNHTSGIFNYTKAARFDRIRKTDPQAQLSPSQLVNIASAFPSYFPPGKGWRYSNTNYVLAGMIIEKVTKLPMNQLMEYYLHGNDRLYLANTFYWPRIYTAEEIARVAHGYSCNGYDVVTSNMSWAYTAGAIVSTSADLITWWQSLFQDRVLPKPQLAQMMSLVCENTSRKNHCVAGSSAPHLEDWQVDKRYGLGVIQSASGSSSVGTIWWHNGSTQGYKAIVMWYPKSNIYMSLMIDRDPGYLLKPNLPLIRNAMQVLLTGSYTPLAAKSRTVHYRQHVTHRKVHHKKRRHYHKAVT